MNKQKKIQDEYVKQHIVPTSYLKRFARRKNQKNYYIGVRRKTDNDEVRLFNSNIRDIGYVCNYYDVNLHDDPKYWEHYFSRVLEPMYGNDLNNIIAKVVLNANDSTVLGESDKTVLAKMICFQFARVPSFVNVFISKGIEYGESIAQQLQPYLEKQMGSRFNNIVSIATSPDNVKDIILNGITAEERLQKYADILRKRVWIVLYNKTYMPFYTSDNPVIMYNINHKSVEYAYVGIARTDTMLYFPLSSRVMIQILPGIIPKGELRSDLDGKRVILLEDEIKFIMNVNMMQIAHASKDVFMDPDHLLFIKDTIDNSSTDCNK